MTEQDCLNLLNSTITEYNAEVDVLNEMEALITKETKTTTSNYEKIVSSVSTERGTSAAVNFSMNYGGTIREGNMQLVSGSDLANYILSNGGTREKANQYVININGTTYRYNTSSNVLTYGNQSMKCNFYMTSGTKLGKITKTITVLPGSGEQGTGAVGDNRVSVTADLKDGCFVIAPYKSSSASPKLPDNPNGINNCTIFGDYLAGNNKKVSNSVIGCSMGAQAACAAVSNNPSLYDKVVIVNGSSTVSTDTSIDYVKKYGSYSSFRGKEVMFVESLGNYDRWSNSIKTSYNEFKNAGANVTFQTNDKKFLNDISGAKYFDDNKYTSHGHGYKVIEGLHLLSYLSS